ncbi:hypothetical protein AO385_1031 [Moraxella catarrhalis]|uniref:Uncharacterized protein n=1 Tax=Moraxella catarrhalis TaxID=480 RepID=A0A198UFL1_MORCA|nr:hypothetical protein AO384_1409 [Moraxella catarrhalis]OAU99794.1 hypothetical protein AO383_0017 [Moraxella catarrhalis]OAV01492.1 hypothetical protein AO385_1031 [Moraxella catarrhalis]
MIQKTPCANWLLASIRQKTRNRHTAHFRSSGCQFFSTHHLLQFDFIFDYYKIKKWLNYHIQKCKSDLLKC